MDKLFVCEQQKCLEANFRNLASDKEDVVEVVGRVTGKTTSPISMKLGGRGVAQAKKQMFVNIAKSVGLGRINAVHLKTPVDGSKVQ